MDGCVGVLYLEDLGRTRRTRTDPDGPDGPGRTPLGIMYLIRYTIVVSDAGFSGQSGPGTLTL